MSNLKDFISQCTRRRKGIRHGARIRAEEMTTLIEGGDHDYKPPSIMFLTVISLSFTISTSSAIFIGITHSGRFTSLPKFHLPMRDPIVMSLLGAITCANACVIGGLISQLIVPSCHWAFKVAPVMYIVSYYFINIFLLAKLRAVDIKLKSEVYAKFQKLITLITYFGMPGFMVLVAITGEGKSYGVNGSTFCVEHLPWWVPTLFAICQSAIGLSYLILFTMPVLATQKHVEATAASTSDTAKRLRAVIVRNLVSCSISVGVTFCSLMGLTIVAANNYHNAYPAAWAISFAYIDLTVNIMAAMYAINPAWYYEDGSHASTRRHQATLHSRENSKVLGGPSSKGSNKGGSKRNTVVDRAPALGTLDESQRELEPIEQSFQGSFQTGSNHSSRGIPLNSREEHDERKLISNRLAYLAAADRSDQARHSGDPDQLSDVEGGVAIPSVEGGVAIPSVEGGVAVAIQSVQFAKDPNQPDSNDVIPNL